MNLSYLEVIVSNKSEVHKMNFDAEKISRDAKYRAFVTSVIEENKDRLVSMCVVQRCEGQFIG